MKYLVEIREVHVYLYEVEASSTGEADALAHGLEQRGIIQQHSIANKYTSQIALAESSSWMKGLFTAEFAGQASFIANDSKQGVSNGPSDHELEHIKEILGAVKKFSSYGDLNLTYRLFHAGSSCLERICAYLGLLGYDADFSRGLDDEGTYTDEIRVSWGIK
jgi:hypothetical protein